MNAERICHTFLYSHSFIIRISCFQFRLHIVLHVFACFVAFPHLQMRLQQEANQKIAELSEKAHSEAIQ